MERDATSIQTRDLSGTIANIVIRLGALTILVVWCFRILQPFLLPAIWGIIIAVAIYPLYRSLTLIPFLRGRPALAATLVSTVLLALLLVPTAMLTELLVQNTASLAQTVREQQFVIPAVIYVFATSDTVTAVVFLIWSVVLLLLDNVLKPLLLGRGLDVPTVVIFLGAIGGMLMSGIVGLFVGAIVLALGYKLLQAWIIPEALPKAAGDQ